MTTRTTSLIAWAALGVATAACTTAAPIADDMTADIAGDMTMDTAEAMNMGDPTAPAAEDVRGADLASGSFRLLDSAPTGYEGVAGRADLARHDAGTTVTIELDGLPANTEFISHLHSGACADAGGPHFMFDPFGPAMPPNEIHLAFTSDAAGYGFMTAENSATVPDDARSVVIHPMRSTSAKVACADFER